MPEETKFCVGKDHITTQHLHTQNGNLNIQHHSVSKIEGNVTCVKDS